MKKLTATLMMKKFFFLIFFSLLSLFPSEKLFAQDHHKIDSIRTELKRYSMENNPPSIIDSEVVNLYNGLSLLYISSEPDSAILYGTKALDLSRRISFNSGIIMALNNLFGGYELTQNYTKSLEVSTQLAISARIVNKDKTLCRAFNKIAYSHYRLGNTDSALHYYTISLRMAQTIKDTQSISRDYGGFALVYDMKANYDSAIANYKKQLEYLIILKDTSSQAMVLLDIGLAYRNSNAPLALDYLFRALKIAESRKIDYYIGCAMHSIGLIYAGQNRIDEALKYFNEALAKFEKTGSIDFASNCLSSIGDIYNTHFHKDSLALDYYQRALAGYDSAGDKLYAAVAQMNIGNVFFSQKKYIAAINNYDEALKEFGEAEDNYNYQVCLHNMGEAYFAMGDNKTALSKANAALELANKLKVIPEQSDIHRLLSDIYAKVRDYKSAYENVKLFKLFSDSVYNTSNTQKITQLQMQYDFDKKQVEQKAEQDKKDAVSAVGLQKQKVQKYSFIAGLIVILIIAFLFINRLRLRQVLKLERIRNDIASDLHDDVGSTLSSINLLSQFASENEDREKLVSRLQRIRETSKQTTENMQDIVWAVNPRNDSMQVILARMRTYALETLDAQERQVHFNIDRNVEEIKLRLDQRHDFYLIFKEAVNNAAKYSKAKNVWIALGKNGKLLKMTIKDDGVGFDETIAQQGNGLINMKKRAENLHGDLAIHSIPTEGITIQLTF